MDIAAIIMITIRTNTLGKEGEKTLGRVTCHSRWTLEKRYALCKVYIVREVEQCTILLNTGGSFCVSELRVGCGL